MGNGLSVLMFYPTAFTSGHTTKLYSFWDSMDALKLLDAQVYGISVDLPFAQNIWMNENALTFSILSDRTHEIIRLYNVVYGNMYQNNRGCTTERVHPRRRWGCDQ